MGAQIEETISEALRDGHGSLSAFLQEGGGFKLFVWMGLIFFKTHLKDQQFREHLDTRVESRKIGDQYEWQDLHHLHCVVRSFYTNCTVEPEAMGSLLIVPVQDRVATDNFDFADLYLSQAMMLRLGDVAIFAVFNDSHGALNYFQRHLERIDGPLSSVQLREILVELAYLNLHLEKRPEFMSKFDPEGEECRIVGIRPSLNLKKLDPKVRAKLFEHALGAVLEKVEFNGRTRPQVMAALNAGTLSFLFDDAGKFIHESWKPLQS
jgi:hypothetical protein